jgi:hypothetical protein
MLTVVCGRTRSGLLARKSGRNAADGLGQASKGVVVDGAELGAASRKRRFKAGPPLRLDAPPVASIPPVGQAACLRPGMTPVAAASVLSAAAVVAAAADAADAPAAASVSMPAWPTCEWGTETLPREFEGRCAALEARVRMVGPDGGAGVVDVLAFRV